MVRKLLFSVENAIAKKKEKGPANGNAETGQIKTGDLAITKVGANQSAHHGARDTNGDMWMISPRGSSEPATCLY